MYFEKTNGLKALMKFTLPLSGDKYLIFPKFGANQPHSDLSLKIVLNDLKSHRRSQISLENFYTQFRNIIKSPHTSFQHDRRPLSPLIKKYLHRRQTEISGYLDRYRGSDDSRRICKNPELVHKNSHPLPHHTGLLE